MEKIHIGKNVIFAPDTRVLANTENRKTIAIGVSPANCLKGLLQAEGRVLSQDTLIDIGWRQAGIEVTISSVRVAMNQLRRAFAHLQVEKELVIITVPREGYRLVVTHPHSDSPLLAEISRPADLSAQEDAEHDALLSAQPDTPEVPASAGWKRFAGVAVIALALGCALAWGIKRALLPEPVPISYQPVNSATAGAGPELHIFAVQSPRVTDELVRKTVRFWREYPDAAGKETFLYVHGGNDAFHYGLFACARSIEENSSGCKSFVFKTN